MKITPKQYAQALYESVMGKNREEAQKTIKEFARVLILNNDLQKVDAVTRLFKEIYNQEKGIVRAEIISAIKLNNQTIKELKEYIKEKTQAKKVETLEKVDKNLIGGTIIKYGDKILDGCLRTRINTLKLELIK